MSQKQQILVCQVSHTYLSNITYLFVKYHILSCQVSHTYLSCIGGKYSTVSISDNQRASRLDTEESNSISESNHAQLTHSLKIYGTVWLDSVAAEGITRTNNEFGRGHEAFVTGHTSKDGKVPCVFETFHSLPI